MQEKELLFMSGGCSHAGDDKYNKLRQEAWRNRKDLCDSRRLSPLNEKTPLSLSYLTLVWPMLLFNLIISCPCKYSAASYLLLFKANPYVSSCLSVFPAKTSRNYAPSLLIRAVTELLLSSLFLISSEILM
jgi:hypothetical protein